MKIYDHRRYFIYPTSPGEYRKTNFYTLLNSKLKLDPISELVPPTLLPPFTFRSAESKSLLKYVTFQI